MSPEKKLREYVETGRLHDAVAADLDETVIEILIDLVREALDDAETD